MDKEQYLDILKSNIKPTSQKLLLRYHWTFQHDIDIKHSPQIVMECLDDSKFKDWCIW